MIRTSTVIGRCPPTRSKVPSCRILSSLTCASSGSSPPHRGITFRHRPLEPSLLEAHRTRETPTFVTEKLGVDQPGQESPAVDAHDGPGLARDRV